MTAEALENEGNAVRVHPPFGVCKKGFLRACGKPARCCHILRDRVIQLRVKRGLGENSHVPQVRLSYSSFYLVFSTEQALGFCTTNYPKRGRLCVRAGEVGLASEEIKKLFDHGISCLRNLLLPLAHRARFHGRASECPFLGEVLTLGTWLLLRS